MNKVLFAALSLLLLAACAQPKADTGDPIPPGSRPGMFIEPSQLACKGPVRVTAESFLVPAPTPHAPFYRAYLGRGGAGESHYILELNESHDVFASRFLLDLKTGSLAVTDIQGGEQARNETRTYAKGDAGYAAQLARLQEHVERIASGYPGFGNGAAEQMNETAACLRSLAS